MGEDHSRPSFFTALVMMCRISSSIASGKSLMLLQCVAESSVGLRDQSSKPDSAIDMVSSLSFSNAPRETRLETRLRKDLRL